MQGLSDVRQIEVHMSAVVAIQQCLVLLSLVLIYAVDIVLPTTTCGYPVLS